MKRTLKNMILEVMTLAAVLLFTISLFFVDLHPIRCGALMSVGLIWMILFGTANLARWEEE